MTARQMLTTLPALLLLVPALILTGCSDDDDDFLTSPGPGEAMLRVTHLSPDAPNVDIWLDGTVVLADVPYTAASDYLTVDAGNRRVQVTPAGASEPVVIDATVPLMAGGSYTVAATGLLARSDLEPLVLVDDDATSGTMTKVRFVHTSPDAPAVDVAVTGGPVLFSNVPFRETADYIEVAPGSYDLEVRLAGTSTVVLSLPGVALEADTNVTIFAIGQVADSTLGALPVLDLP